MLRAVVALSGVVLIALVAQSQAPDARIPPAAVPAVPDSQVESPSLPAVRIEHEIVRVPAPPAAPRAVARPQPATRSARLDRQPAGETPSRVHRVLFGDGTYRPEPFPRPGRD